MCFLQLKAHLVTNSQIHFLTDSESPDLPLHEGEMLELIMQPTIYSDFLIGLNVKPQNLKFAAVSIKSHLKADENFRQISFD